MTHGNKNCVKCPSCKKSIVGILGGHTITHGQIEFLRNCPLCGTQIRVWARCDIVVDVEKESKVK